MQGRKVLVTGGAGFIGSHLVERLSGRNTVTVLDDLSTGSIRNLEDSPEEVHVHKGSILQPKALAGAMEAQDIVYHLAARTSPAESVQQPDEYWKTNVEGTLNALKAAVDAALAPLLFFSRPPPPAVRDDEEGRRVRLPGGLAAERTRHGRPADLQRVRTAAGSDVRVCRSDRPVLQRDRRRETHRNTSKR